MSKTAYAIRVPFDSQWLYVQSANGQGHMLFNDKASAKHAALAWKKYEIVEFIYNEDKECYEEEI